MTGCNVLVRDGGTHGATARPNCEYCDKDLPADALTARISAGPNNWFASPMIARWRN